MKDEYAPRPSSEMMRRHLEAKSTPATEAKPDGEGLVERLRRPIPYTCPPGTRVINPLLVNPDGPEAAGRIMALEARIAQLEHPVAQSPADDVVERVPWQVTDAYAGIPDKSDVTDEDGHPLWNCPIECSQGYAQVAEVCGGSEREAMVRAEVIAAALRGQAVTPGEAVNHIERLYSSANEDDWITAEFLTATVSALATLQAGPVAQALAATPTVPTSQSTDDVERVARAIEADLCRDGGRNVGAIWASERGREQMLISARAAIAALAPATSSLSYEDGLEAAAKIADGIGQRADVEWRSAIAADTVKHVASEIATAIRSIQAPVPITEEPGVKALPTLLDGEQ